MSLRDAVAGRLTPLQKFRLYKRKERMAQKIIVNQLYLKPKLVQPLTLPTLNVLRYELFFNYLFEKLKIIDVHLFIKIYNYCNIYLLKLGSFKSKLYLLYHKILKIIWPNSVYLDLKCKYYEVSEEDKKDYIFLDWDEKNLNTNLEIDKVECISLNYQSSLLFLEEYLKPIIYKKIENNKDEYISDIDDSSNEEPEEVIFKKNKITLTDVELDNLYYTFPYARAIRFFKEIPYEEGSVDLHAFSSKEDYKYLKHIYEKFNIYLRNKSVNILKKQQIKSYFYLEELLLLNTNISQNPYKYIDIDKYLMLLQELNIKDKNIIDFQINLAKLHNKNLEKLNIPIEYTELIKTNYIIKKINEVKNMYTNILVEEIKKIEENKVLTEIHLYYEVQYINILKFIEMFLFKFEYILLNDFKYLLNLLYSGVEDQEKFIEFYNTLIEKLNEIKLNLDLDSIHFILEFLEFLYKISYISGLSIVFFENSVAAVKDFRDFKDLRLFRFNYFKRFYLFLVNNNKSYYNFYLDSDTYENLYILIKNYFKKFYVNIEKKIYLYDKFDASIYNEFKKFEIVGSNLNTNLYLIPKYLQILNYLNYTLRFKRKVKVKNNKLRKKMVENMIILFNEKQNLINEILISNLKLDKISEYFFNFTIPFFQNLNVIKYKEILFFKSLYEYILAYRNREVLALNIEMFQEKFVEIFKKHMNLRFKIYRNLIDYNIKNKKKIDLNLVKFWYYDKNIFKIKNKLIKQSIKNIKEYQDLYIEFLNYIKLERKSKFKINKLLKTKKIVKEIKKINAFSV